MRTLGFLAATVLFAAAPATAAPEASAQTATIMFDPPVGKPLTYRWEKSVRNEGQATTTAWTVDEYRFEADGDGYRLTVKPVSHGAPETPPETAALMKELTALTRVPFVLRVNEDAEIVALDRSDELWAGIFKAMRASIGNKAPGTAEAKGIEAVISPFENMPPEARLAKLTESVQPLIEFAATETTVGEPITVKAAAASPFGAVERDVTISLNRVAGGIAYITVRASLPQAEFQKLMRSVLDGLAKDAMSAADLAKAKAEIGNLKAYRHESQADYEVSISDGILQRFSSTETIEIAAGKDSKQRVTKTSITRLP